MKKGAGEEGRIGSWIFSFFNVNFVDIFGMHPLYVGIGFTNNNTIKNFNFIIMIKIKMQYFKKVIPHYFK